MWTCFVNIPVLTTPKVLFRRMEGGREGRVGEKTRAATWKGEHEWVALTPGPPEWAVRSVDSRFFSSLEKTSPPFLGCPSGSPPNSMLRVLLSAQASAARLSGLLLLPPVQPCCLGPSKWGDRPPGGGLHAGPVQGLQRLLEQARSPGELLRWLGQNPTKVRAHHYPVALRRLGQLLGSQPRPPPVEQATLQDLSQLIIRNCPSFDPHTVHVCLHLAVLLGFPSDGPLMCALEQERRFRLPPKPPPTLQPDLCGGQRLEAALSCPRLLRRPRQHLIRSLAEARPEELTPNVMVLLAQHLARHRLREPQLLEAIAHFLVVQEAQLSSKVVQKLVLPFGRLNYLPLEQQFMPCLERILAREAGVAPLATVNILMSLCQLRCLPLRALHFVFSPSFINHISGTPHALIVRRYLSLLDTAVELELPGYRGPRLPRRQQVPIFPQPLITDRARCKYSHKDIVAEGLRQLLGEEKYRQDLTVPPGYCTGWCSCCGNVGISAAMAECCWAPGPYGSGTWACWATSSCRYPSRNWSHREACPSSRAT
ncbi:fas-activated serine/threonine kinase isoform X3 [Mustela erminea]|uniref:fas-activated serine/threonine kinase isoform X3 n=1 Tax=Mustela erminea TaxID=36723 RepID=UPI001386C6D6|nr:fas-activated serine/threonine kinase isoform X3 [Mustela erminea]